MTYWEARRDFDPSEPYEWVEVTDHPDDEMCQFCGLALASEDRALVTSVWYKRTQNEVRLGLVPADWDDSLVYAHPDDTCPGAGTSVTVRTRD